MEEEGKEIENWREIAKKGKEIFTFAKALVKKEAKMLDVVKQIEKKVKQEGLNLAFPVNISCNEVAAHYTPAENDETKLNGLVKLDIGVMKDGYICDMAESFDLTEDKRFTKMIEASSLALKNAVKIIKEGTTLGRIGNAIQGAITSHGFSPIINLCGHELEKYKLHSGLTVPNHDNKSTFQLKENQILAIEPFATSGVGIVQDGKPSGIYYLLEKKPVRDMMARKIADFIEKEYKTLPFCSRWIVEQFGSRAVFSLKLLEQSGILYHYNQLVEKSKQPVSQSEHTVLVKKNSCEILTA